MAASRRSSPVAPGSSAPTLSTDFCARDRDVTVLDDLSTGRLENLVAALNAGARLHEASVTDAAAVARVFEAARPELVFHLAAQIDVRRAVEDPGFDATANVIGTLNVLEAARRCGARRFVLASTGGAIYGEADELPTPESAPARPLSPYAASKAAAEGYLDLYARLHGLSTMSLRLANVYGPRQDPRGEGGVIAIFCDAAADGRRVTVYGDGGQTRDFVFVGDVVDAFMAAGDGARPAAATSRPAARRRCSRSRRRSASRSSSRPSGPARCGARACSPMPPRRLLGWRPRTSLRDGLEMTVAHAGETRGRPARAAA